jgi:hypothetical protein
VSRIGKIAAAVFFLVATLGTAGLVWERSFAVWARPEQVGTAIDPHAPRYPVVVHPGPDVPKVKTAILTHAGTPSDVSCATCHTTRAAQVQIKSAGQLKEFHQGMQYVHGEISCLSCHNAGNYDTLRKADGTPVNFVQTQQLCAQCHGPQYRDYQHGSHGGMTGHWDLTRGPRERNTCTDCHDPHAPAFSRVMPVFAPVDVGARQQRARAVQGEHTHE